MENKTAKKINSLKFIFEFLYSKFLNDISLWVHHVHSGYSAKFFKRSRCLVWKVISSNFLDRYPLFALRTGFFSCWLFSFKFQLFETCSKHMFIRMSILSNALMKNSIVCFQAGIQTPLFYRNFLIPTTKARNRSFVLAFFSLLSAISNEFQRTEKGALLASTEKVLVLLNWKQCSVQ